MIELGDVLLLVNLILIAVLAPRILKRKPPAVEEATAEPADTEENLIELPEVSEQTRSQLKFDPKLKRVTRR